MFTGSLLLNIVGLLIVTVILIIAYFKKQFSFWKNKGVEYLEPSIPFGNSKDNFKGKLSTGEWFTNFYGTMKARKLIHAGSYFFHRPIYVVIDLDLVKQILQVDFSHFTDHGTYVNEKHDPLSAHVFSLKGQRWRNLRAKLTPTFTSGKMRNMFPIFVKVSQELVEVIDNETKMGEPFETKEISARLTTDIIGNCAFGIDCNSLKDPNTEFRKQGKRLLTLTYTEMLRNFFSFLFPNAMNFFGVRLFPKGPTDFFWNTIKQTTEYREKNNVRRNDALQLLLDMKNNDGSLTFNELAAQAFIFFVGGFETSSTLMSFALLELSLYEDVQSKLREEVNAVVKRNNGEITYESMAEMHYMDMVINETLRKYPPLPVLTRECTKDYQVPNTEIIIPKGTTTFIPIRGIHYDPEYYPDPHKFDPTRFDERHKAERHQFAYLPFGEGPRVCLGLRFGVMQAKVGLATIIKNFRIKASSRTEMPIKYDPANFLTSSKGGLWVDVERINQ